MVPVETHYRSSLLTVLTRLGIFQFGAIPVHGFHMCPWGSLILRQSPKHNFGDPVSDMPFPLTRLLPKPHMSFTALC